MGGVGKKGLNYVGDGDGGCRKERWYNTADVATFSGSTHKSKNIGKNLGTIPYARVRTHYETYRDRALQYL